MPECTECGMVFMDAEDMYQHMKKFHPYERTRETL